MKMYILVLQAASDIDPGLDGVVMFGEKFQLLIPQGQERGPIQERLQQLSDEEVNEVRTHMND